MKLSQYQKRILHFLGLRLSNFAVNVLLKTVRIEIKNGQKISELISEKKNFVAAFWHGSMMIGWYLHRNKNFSSLVSKSKDGDLLGKILKRWNYPVIRGSSSVGGDVALGIMVDYAKNNNSIAITPDGPRGPAFKLKAGAIITSKRSGLPLVLLGIGFKNKKLLKSWDSFQVPFFFTKATAVFSDPIYVDNKLGYDDTSKIIENCERQLRKLQEAADKFN